MSFDPSKSCLIWIPSVPLSLRRKQLWLKSVPKATPTKRPYETWGFPGGDSAVGNHPARRNPRAGTPVSPVGAASSSPARQAVRPGSSSLSGGDSGPPSRPAQGSFAWGRARRRRAGGRARPGRRRARALTARPCSLTRSSPASEHSMAVKVTLNSLLLPSLHKRHSGDLSFSPSPLNISFFAWFLDSVSWGSSLRVGELCGGWTGGRGCPAGGGEVGGLMSWRGF